jgi:hypothetical protein
LHEGDGNVSKADIAQNDVYKKDEGEREDVGEAGLERDMGIRYGLEHLERKPSSHATNEHVDPCQGEWESETKDLENPFVGDDGHDVGGPP